MDQERRETMSRIAVNPSILAAWALLAALFLWPFLVPHDGIHFRVMGMACFHGCLAMAWNLSSLAGTVSLGHAAFFGLGAYGSALCNHYTHVSPYLTILFGGLLGALYGMGWHAVFKRLRGAPFALATLASVEIPKVIIDNWNSFTFGSLGVVGIPGLPTVELGSLLVRFDESPGAMYTLLLTCMLGAGLLHRRALVSRWGWGVRALREDETAAEALGVNTNRIRFQVITVSGFFTGVCGGLYAHLLGLIEPGLVFSLHMSAMPLVLTIFGGRFQWYGPLLGALILYPLDQWLFRSLLPVGHSVLYGLVVIVTLILFPQGMGKWLQKSLQRASS